MDKVNHGKLILHMHDDMTRLLASVRKLHEGRSKNLANTADRFNVFHALNIEDRELRHSKFLAYLINPRQRHDQRDVLLRSFLARAGISTPDRLDGVEVLTEMPIPGGQLDILLRIPLKMTIVIENKVWAGDQENQVGKYLDWLNTKCLDTPIRFVIYLTPTGRPPGGTILDSSQIKCLSYSTIACWLESHQSLPDRLRTVTEMYSETCRRIAGGLMKNEFSRELVELVSSNENFALALEIASIVEAHRSRVVERFWENVRTVLARSLADARLSNHWTAVLSPEITDKSCWLAIMATPDQKAVSAKSAIDYKSSYAVTAECSSTYQCYGVWRPPLKRSAELQRLDEEMVKGLCHENFKSNNWWCGWKHLSDSGLVDRSQNQNEWIEKLNLDSQNIQTPLASQVAHGMWDLFIRFQEPLEALNLLVAYD